jgi:2-oxoglutarate dehydrogenase E2 component (dihydrolipoamide succinyltransferase)
MTKEVKVPLLPESVSDATISHWNKKVGDQVKRDENLVDLETDKVMLEVPSPIEGVLKEIIKPTGSTVQAQEVIAIIEAKGAEESSKNSGKKTAKEDKQEERKEVKKEPSREEMSHQKASPAPSDLSPSERRRVAAAAAGDKSDQASKSVKQTVPSSSQYAHGHGRIEKRVPMTRMRARIAERLLEVTQNTAMLTT